VSLQVIFKADVHEPVLLDGIAVHLSMMKEGRQGILNEEVVEKVRDWAI
jgi:hypothetical protein